MRSAAGAPKGPMTDVPLRLGTGQTICEHSLREVEESVLDQEWRKGAS